MAPGPNGFQCAVVAAPGPKPTYDGFQWFLPHAKIRASDQTIFLPNLLPDRDLFAPLPTNRMNS